MAEISWKKMGAILAAASAGVVLLGAMVPVVKSDPPPWRGITQSEALVDRIERDHEIATQKLFSRIVQSDIERVRRMYCAARDAKTADILDLGNQLSKALIEYRTVAGSDYPLEPCP